MAILTPLWLQNGSYPARYDRQFIERAFGRREMAFDGFTVTQHGAGDVSVDVSLGAGTVLGDDQAGQGMYLVVMDATANVSFPAVPGSNKRIDRLSLKVNDPQAGGSVGDNATWVVTQGSVSATPVAPTTPDSALAVADVLRTAGDSAILTVQLTDLLARGVWPYIVSLSAVPAKLPPNYLYVQVA